MIIKTIIKQEMETEIALTEPLYKSDVCGIYYYRFAPHGDTIETTKLFNNSSQYGCISISIGDLGAADLATFQDGKTITEDEFNQAVNAWLQRLNIKPTSL